MPHNAIPTEIDPEDLQREPIEVLAAEYMDRRRKGELVRIEEYIAREPSLEAEIRDLFPTIDAIESLGSHISEPKWNPKRELDMPPRLGDYRLIREIARGGMGIIYLAEQESLQREVAIKILVGPSIPREQDLLRFHREAHTAAKLLHTNIVPIFGVGEQDGLHYIVMQLIQGVGLDEVFSELQILRSETGWKRDEGLSNRRLQARKVAFSLVQSNWGTGSESAPFDPQKDIDRSSIHWTSYYRNMARIGRQISSALSYAHRQHILHRDMKPGNILVDHLGSSWIADFGLARSIDGDGITVAGDMVGTLAYMSPERFSGDVLESSDQFGLGVTLYEMLTLERAYTGGEKISVMFRISQQDLPRLRKVVPSISSDFETIIGKTIARAPADRYANCDELAGDFERYLTGNNILARRFSLIELGWKWCARNRVIASLAGMVMLFMATTFFATAAGYWREAALRYRAESTSGLALNALDEIYGRFSPSPLDFSSEIGNNEEDWQSLIPRSQPTISKDVSIVLENLLRFYDDLSKLSDKNEGIVKKSIAASRRVGDIQKRLGETEKAKLSYESAIMRINQLPNEIHGDPDIHLELARACNGLGSILQRMGKGGEASERHLSAVNALEGIETKNPIHRLELANSLLLQHRSLLMQGGFRRRNFRNASNEPSPQIQRAIDLLNGLVEENPREPEYQFLLARCLNTAPSVRDLWEGKSLCEDRAFEILEKLVKDWPNNADFQYELGDAYVNADWRRVQNRDEKSDSETREASERRLFKGIEYSSKLMTRFPQIPEYANLVNRANFHMAMLQKAKGTLDASLPYFEKSIELQSSSIQNQGASYKIGDLLWLCNLRMEYSSVLSELQRMSGAQLQLEKCRDSLTEARAKADANDFDRRMIDRTRSRLDELMQKLNSSTSSHL